MKGIFELKPTFPKYHMVWNVNTVFNLFRSLESPACLTLKNLTQKLALLLVLLSGGQRCQTIHQINVVDIKIVGRLMVIPVMSKLKQSRAGKHMEPLKFECFLKDSKLCVVTHMTEYLKQTSEFRGMSKKLFLGLQKPHSEVSKDTIARWCKNVLAQCDIDISVYASHSSWQSRRDLYEQHSQICWLEWRTSIRQVL